MSSLLFLSSDDFTIQQGEKGPIMCTDIQGISLILFYSTQCVYCQNMIPMFKNLPNIITGCQFGMVNVSTNKKMVQMARSTIAPIQYVPLIILYVNGKPFMKYDGPSDPHEIRNFIMEVSNMVQNSNLFMGDNKRVKHHKRSIPQYTVGVPMCGEDGKCYLEYDEAYDK